MKNLAGDRDCDREICRELERCGIEIVPCAPHRGDVQYSVMGKLRDFTFTRSWYYWCVSGKMPLEKARELYANRVGKTDIRVEGHCGCPPPDDRPVRFHDGKVVVDKKEFEMAESFGPALLKSFQEGHTTHPDPESLPAFVTSYHVDSELGLYILAEAIRSLPA